MLPIDWPIHPRKPSDVRRAYNSYLEFRSALAASDSLYPLMIKTVSLVRPGQKRLLAKQSTDIVIDGFPRSANTYFVSFFELAQQRKEIEIARHLHESYQFRYAERHGIPCVVLVRNPKDAIVSAILRDGRASIAVLARNYSRFYTNLLEHHRRSVIAPFQTVIDDANTIISAVNKSYGTSFLLLPEDQKADVLAEVNRKDRLAFGTSRPEVTRAALPSAAKKTAAKAIEGSLLSQHADALDNANAIYEAVMAKARTADPDVRPPCP